MGDLQEESPSPFIISPERWAAAERITEQIIRKVQPTHTSEAKRRKVVSFLYNLMKKALGCEVFAYGSVPLKTYLPDGDIDLTAFGGPKMEDVIANGIVAVLEKADQSGSSEFRVTDIQVIHAEVKIIKCIVQKTVVDISVNQIGGVCTLCFLEQVDRLIGKDHLFKRSIILIKAWCYYESRILGAHHGLISTYGLETLVLYIFHLFHSTLDGPLAVLYKFLDYYSKFEWDKYCVSLTGPVSISSLPEIVVERPENDGGDLLLSNDFLRSCIELFSAPTRDSRSRSFQNKFLNIVDPLLEHNNLGRSVNRGNFYRIKSAFDYGARKLERILMIPENDVLTDKLHNFFSNTMAKHGDEQRPDVQENHIPLGPTLNIPAHESSGKIEEGKMKQNASSESNERFGAVTELCTNSMSSNSGKEPSLLSQPHLLFCKTSSSTVEDGGSGSGSGSGRVRQTIPFYAPHLHFTKNLSSEMEKVKISSEVSKESVLDNEDESKFLEDVKSKNSLADLSGDYDSHFNCLQFARLSFGHGMGMPPVHMPPPHHRFPMNSPLDIIQHPPQPKRNSYSHGNANSSTPYPMNPLPMPRLGFSSQDMPKPLGTGTYFPIMGPQVNPSPQGYRPLQGNGRHQLPLRSSPRNPDRVSSHELPAGSSDVQQTFPGLVIQPEGFIGYNPVGPLPSLLEKTLQQQRLNSTSSSPSPSPSNSAPVSPNLGLNPVFKDHDRVSARSMYRLKNEEDFQPLSV